jgi:hypothetical protein
MNFKRLIFLISAIFVDLCVLAQSASSSQNVPLIDIWGHVRDSFTKAGISNVKITIMTLDSVVIDTAHVFGSTRPGDVYDAAYKIPVPAVPQKLIIKAEHPDYEDCYVNFNMRYIKRNTYFDAKWHFMKRRIKKEVLLDEVVVKGTKVRFTYHGDTLVYNADAFNVPNGSMLDGLLKQMDGVEMDANGNIKVNGRHVDYITLNGKDFFKGNNQIILENLPYYVVQNVKIFERATERSEFLKRKVDQNDYVMDVQLKRQYNIGDLGNIESGGGVASQSDLERSTKLKSDRYLSRVFGSRFTDHSRITLFGNMNNISQNGSVDNSGEWRDYPNNSQFRSKSIGSNVLLSGKGDAVTNEISATAKWLDEENSKRENIENYLSSGSNYGINLSNTNTHWGHVDFENLFKLKLPQLIVPFSLSSRLSVTYHDEKSTGDADDMMFANNPFADGTVSVDTINKSLQKYDNRNSALSLQMNNSALFKLPWGDHIDFFLWGMYENKKNDEYSLNSYSYWLAPSNNSLQNRYAHAPYSNLLIGGNIDYSFDWLSGWRLELGLTYNNQYKKSTSDYYRLDKLGSKYSDVTAESWYKMLPSNRDSLLLCLDLNNSYYYDYREYNSHPYVLLSYSKSEKGNTENFDVRFYPAFYQRNIRYYSQATNPDVNQNQVAYIFKTNYELSKNYMKKHGKISMEFTQELPDMYDMLDITNSPNPLVVKKGNPDLKKSTTVSLSSYYQTRGRKDFNSYLSLTAEVVRDAIAQGCTYDSSTGVRTYCPENVNGNWNANFSSNLGAAIDSLKRFHWHISTSYGFNHNVDVANASTENNHDRSTVISNTVTVEPSMNYHRQKLSLRASSKLMWINSHRQNAVSLYDPNMNIYNFSYGMDGSYTLFSNLQLSTDFRIYSWRGYAADEMNIDKPIWNVQLSQSFCKEKILIKLIGNDVLGKRTNVTYAVNAQGRTETWRNSLGRYMMLSVRWKFNYTPHK